MSVSVKKSRTALLLLGMSAFYVILFWGIWQFFADIPHVNQVFLERFDDQPVFAEIAWLPDSNRFAFDLVGFPLLLTGGWLVAQKYTHLSQQMLLGIVGGLVISLFSAGFGFAVGASLGILALAVYLVVACFGDLINIILWLLKRESDRLTNDTIELLCIIAPVAVITVIAFTFNGLFGFVLFVAYSTVALFITATTTYLWKAVRRPVPKPVD